jgi:DNA polymerase
MSRRLQIVDSNAIETRCGAWVAQCPSLLNVFTPRPGKPNGNDPYIDFGGTKLKGIPYERMEADLKSVDKMIRKAAKDDRQMGKVGVLGCIYRMGGGGWGKHPKTKDVVKTGLWNYAEGYGVVMTQDQAHKIVDIFRESYIEIVQTWFFIEKSIAEVLQGERTVRYLGPDNCIKIDKVTIDGRKPLLRIQLPSGRYLHYLDSSIEIVKMPWNKKNQETGEDEDVYKPGFTYYGLNQDTKQWSLIVSHGGKVFENIVQGIARDVLADKLLKLEDAGAPVVMHVHDEPVCEVQDDPFSLTIEEMIDIMSKPISWAPGLPLGADGFESKYYHK